MYRSAIIGILIPTLFIPLFTLFILILFKDITVKDAIIRSLATLSFLPLTFFVGCYSGVSYAVIRAPDWYLNSQLGIKWMELTGVKSRTASNVLCSIFLMFSISLYGGMILLAWNATPFT